MHLCPEEVLVVLSAAPMAGYLIEKCRQCAAVFLTRLRNKPVVPPPMTEGYHWFNYHPEYTCPESGEVRWFDEPGGG